MLVSYLKKQRNENENTQKRVTGSNFLNKLIYVIIFTIIYNSDFNNWAVLL